MNNQQPLLEFRNNTRKRFASFASKSLTAGSAVEAPEIPKVGFLSAIYLTVTGVVTISSGTLKDFGFNALKRIRVSLNQGSDDLVNISGYGLQVYNQITNKSFAINKAGAGSTTVDSDLYTIPTADGSAQAFKIVYKIPIAMNDGSNFETGLINLQATDLRARVQLDAGSTTDWGTGYSAITGTVNFAYEYYEVPNPLQVAFPPANLVLRLLEETTSLTSAGDNIYEVPRAGGLLHLLHTIKPNATRNNTDVSGFKLKFNKTDTVEDVTKEIFKIRARERYGVDLPTGTFAWDFHYANDVPNVGSFRDVLDTEQITTTESIITLASGVTLGSNNNTVDSVRRIIQMLR